MNKEYKRGLADGMERAAKILDQTGPYDRSALAETIRTIAAGGNPCEDCGKPLPHGHTRECVSRSFWRKIDTEYEL